MEKDIKMSRVILVVCKDVHEFHTYTSHCNYEVVKLRGMGQTVEDVTYRYVDNARRVIEAPSSEIQFIGNFDQRSDLKNIQATAEAFVANKLHEMCQIKKET